MARSTSTSRLRPYLLGLLASAGLLLAGGPVVAQEAARWDAHNPADLIEPVKVVADNIATWMEGNQRLVLLQGKVWVSQGVTNLKMDQGLIWIDEDRKQKTGTYELNIYAENNVFLEAGGNNQTAATAIVGLRSKGALKFQSVGNKIIQQAYPNDPVYQRALREVVGLPPAPAPAKVDARLTVPPMPAGGNNLPPPVTAKPVAAPPVVLPVPKSVTAASVEVPPGQLQPVGGLGQPNQGAQPIPAVPPQNGILPVPRVVPGPGGGISAGGGKQIIIRPRSSFQDISGKNEILPNGETAYIVTTGIILTVTNADGAGGILDIEADRLVVWTRGAPPQFFRNLQDGADAADQHYEFYLAGNVEIRTLIKKESRLLRAAEVYYDVSRNVAVATHADLEINDPRLLNPIHFKSEEIIQLNANVFRALNAEVSASALPSDPGVSVFVRDGEIESKEVVRTNIFGRPVIDRVTGQPIVETQRYFKGKNVFLQVEEFPIFWSPYLQGDAEDPLGPLENVGFTFNKIFGFQVYTTWDMYDLLGITQPPGARWRLNVDGMTYRGLALGTTYTATGVDQFDIPNRYTLTGKAYGLHDSGTDILGGGRGTQFRVAPLTVVPVTHPDWRGRATVYDNVQDLPNGFTAQGGISAISDRNFLEQFFAPEWQNGMNQETFAYLKQQQDNWAWSALVEPRIRPWITETQWYPRVDGNLVGLKAFDLLTYNARASAGYAELRVTDQPGFAYLPTDVNINTGRFDLMQDVSLPFTLGAFKLAPYGVVDLAYYTEDLTGEDTGRLYGGGGLRASLPFSHLYEDVDSELFNLNGIYHKIVFSGNYYLAGSDVSFRQLPQLDRLNDDASDQALRDIRPSQYLLNPANGVNLVNNPLFDPQVMAVRKLVMDRIDTLDDINVLQMGVRQRWQTKRGYPGRQHIVDWMTLNLTASAFPAAERDNFGSAFAFLEYDWTWNIGDRTSLVSSGWLDPIDGGARLFNIGADINRPDATSFYLGYRQIDPLESKAVIGQVNYALSRKYSVGASAMYDFGVKNQVTSLVLTRSGKDLRVSFGGSYNSILGTYGVILEIVPNLSAGGIRSPATPGAYTAGAMGGR